MKTAYENYARNSLQIVFLSNNQMITNCFHIGIVCSIETKFDWRCDSGGLGGGENLGHCHVM